VIPEEVQGSDLHFTVILVVPPAAMAQGIVLGEPNVANVTVPGTCDVLYVYVTYLAVYTVCSI